MEPRDEQVSLSWVWYDVLRPILMSLAVMFPYIKSGWLKGMGLMFWRVLVAAYGFSLIVVPAGLVGVGICFAADYGEPKGTGQTILATYVLGFAAAFCKYLFLVVYEMATYNRARDGYGYEVDKDPRVKAVFGHLKKLWNLF